MRTNLLSILTLGILSLFCGEAFSQPIQSCPPPCVNPQNRATLEQTLARFQGCTGTAAFPLSYDTPNSACYAAYLNAFNNSANSAFNALFNYLLAQNPPNCNLVNFCQRPSTVEGDGRWVIDPATGESVWVQNYVTVTYNVYCSNCLDYIFYSFISDDAAICAKVNFYERTAYSNYLHCVNQANPVMPPAICFLVDFNQDGGVDGNDLALFMSEYADGLSTADVNGDGGVDGADIEVFMETWENGGCD